MSNTGIVNKTNRQCRLDIKILQKFLKDHHDIAACAPTHNMGTRLTVAPRKHSPHAHKYLNMLIFFFLIACVVHFH